MQLLQPIFSLSRYRMSRDGSRNQPFVRTLERSAST
jgi:hypothetical protein